MSTSSNISTTQQLAPSASHNTHNDNSSSSYTYKTDTHPLIINQGKNKMDPDSKPSSSKAQGSNGTPSQHAAAGFRPQVGMTVQPPRQEDLQKSYASIVGNDANPKGWYGSMSTYYELRPPTPTHLGRPAHG